MENNFNWPNHKLAVIIFGVVGLLATALALSLLFTVLLPKIKVATKEFESKQSKLQPAPVVPRSQESVSVIDSTNDVSKLIILGKKLDYLGDFSQLGKVADKILSLAKTDSDRAMGHYLKSSYNLYLKDYVEAKKSANNAIQLDAKLAGPYNILSMIAGNESNNELSLQYAQKAIALDPNNALAHSLLGIAYNFKGWYALSVDELEKAISLDPNNQYLVTKVAGIGSKP